MQIQNRKKQQRLDDVRGGFGKRLRDEDETKEERSSTQGVGEEKTHNDDSNAATADDDDGITDLTAGDGADSESLRATQRGRGVERRYPERGLLTHAWPLESRSGSRAKGRASVAAFASELRCLPRNGTRLR